VEIEYSIPIAELVKPEACKPGRTYLAAVNGKAPYLCIHSLKHGHMLVALDTGVCYDPSAFPTTSFRECSCKVIVDGSFGGEMTLSSGTALRPDGRISRGRSLNLSREGAND
jgi:hypothetical protein